MSEKTIAFSKSLQRTIGKLIINKANKQKILIWAIIKTET